VGFRSAPAYVAAKHGIVGLTKNAALEYSARNIRVNSVGPAFIKTPMIKNIDENLLVPLHPIGRLGMPEEVAELVLFLSSDKSSFITGGYFAIDGGYLAQ
jgi:NAD(P)-dependent dehydrogenase (short-subunit alcohol dehydrogenase family)